MIPKISQKGGEGGTRPIFGAFSAEERAVQTPQQRTETLFSCRNPLRTGHPLGLYQLIELFAREMPKLHRCLAQGAVLHVRGVGDLRRLVVKTGRENGGQTGDLVEQISTCLAPDRSPKKVTPTWAAGVCRRAPSALICREKLLATHWRPNPLAVR